LSDGVAGTDDSDEEMSEAEEEDDEEDSEEEESEESEKDKKKASKKSAKKAEKTDKKQETKAKNKKAEEEDEKAEEMEAEDEDEDEDEESGDENDGFGNGDEYILVLHSVKNNRATHMMGDKSPCSILKFPLSYRDALRQITAERDTCTAVNSLKLPEKERLSLVKSLWEEGLLEME